MSQSFHYKDILQYRNPDGSSVLGFLELQHAKQGPVKLSLSIYGVKGLSSDEVYSWLANSLEELAQRQHLKLASGEIKDVQIAAQA